MKIAIFATLLILILAPFTTAIGEKVESKFLWKARKIMANERVDPLWDVYRNSANADSLLAKTQLCIEMAISDAVIRDSVRVVFPAACGDLSMNFFDGKTFLESVGSGVKVQLIGYQIIARFNTGYPVLLSQNSPYEMQIDGVSYSDVMASIGEEEEVVELARGKVRATSDHPTEEFHI